MDKNKNEQAGQGGVCVTRRVEEAVWVGNALVRVIGIDRGRVKLYVRAPRDVAILREELVGRQPAAEQGGR